MRQKGFDDMSGFLDSIHMPLKLVPKILCQNLGAKICIFPNCFPYRSLTKLRINTDFS